MKTEGRQWCDVCQVELHGTTRHRSGTNPPSLPALFGDRICEDCDNAFTRKKPRAIPMNASLRKYIRAIESGRKPAPFKMSVMRMAAPHLKGITDHLPLELTLGGELKK